MAFNLVTNSELHFPPFNNHAFIRKFTLSDHGTALALAHPGDIAFCRPGDTHWTRIHGCFPIWNVGKSANVVFYKGQFYIVCILDIYICCISRKRPAMVRVPIQYSAEDLNWVRIYGAESYLVELSGNLFLVLCNFSRFMFEIFKVDLGQQPAKLVKLERSLDDCALFLGNGPNGPQLLYRSAKQLTGCRGKCIYSEFWREISVADIEEACIRDIPVPDWFLCGWIAPNLLL